jgi:glycosyltransferase involved in cell wall biosynthesis
VSAAAPSISIVIPTFNRCESVRRILDALVRQDCDFAQLEVLVVTDGSSDGTGAMLRDYTAPFELRTIAQTNQGAAAARNHGASQAMGRILLFLDDDLQPTPSLIEMHTNAHANSSSCVVIGPCPPVVHGRLDFFRIEQRAWWEDKYVELARPGHRFNFRDMLAGNFSIEKEAFDRCGGFDTAIRGCGGEDYELGVRLIKADVRFVFAPEAQALHHDDTDLDRSFRRARQEGRADVLIGQRHPELRFTSNLARFTSFYSRRDRIRCDRAFRDSGQGGLRTSAIRRLLDVHEMCNRREAWQSLYIRVREYWYWRGVADELKTRKALARFLQEGPGAGTEPQDEVDLDLRAGLPAAERKLDEVRPAGARVWLGLQSVGRIPTMPAAERLRGAHLRPYLAEQLSWPLMRALAINDAIGRSAVEKSLNTVLRRGPQCG